MQRKEQGFTLAELLVVIAIIGILSALSFAMVAAVQNTSRIQATQVRINALDQALSELYEKYQFRRIDVPERDPVTNAPFNLTSTQKAQVRLHFLYDTMRMEMPTNWNEVTLPPRFGQSDSGLRLVYFNAYTQASAKDPTRVNADVSAKLLYLILMNGTPKLRGAFSDNWVREDTDGLKYFVDSWGNPICFLRWAPALSGSNRQPDLWKWTGGFGRATTPYNQYFVNNLTPDVLVDNYYQEYYDQGKDAESTSLTDYDDGKTVQWTDKFPISSTDFFSSHQSIFRTSILEYPDPLDPVRVRPSLTGTPTRSRPGWTLTPLIYSTGPDGEGGLYDGPTTVVSDPFFDGLGAPDGTGGHFDNIHNHGLGGR
ncbi:MAG: type II secretion system protein [Thermoguttaceae bacterium]